jgi:septal ring factor EnvC (AmiA/AmiB activator)
MDAYTLRKYYRSLNHAELTRRFALECLGYKGGAVYKIHSPLGNADVEGYTHPSISGVVDINGLPKILDVLPRDSVVDFLVEKRQYLDALEANKKLAENYTAHSKTISDQSNEIAELKEDRKEFSKPSYVILQEENRRLEAENLAWRARSDNRDGKIKQLEEELARSRRMHVAAELSFVQANTEKHAALKLAAESPYQHVQTATEYAVMRGLKESVDQLKSEVSLLKAQVNTRDQTIIHLKSVIADLNDGIKGLSNREAEAFRKINEMTKSENQLLKEVCRFKEALQAATKDAARLRDELCQILGAGNWLRDDEFLRMHFDLGDRVVVKALTLLKDHLKELRAAKKATLTEEQIKKIAENIVDEIVSIFSGAPGSTYSIRTRVENAIRKSL